MTKFTLIITLPDAWLQNQLESLHENVESIHVDIVFIVTVNDWKNAIGYAKDCVTHCESVQVFRGVSLFNAQRRAATIVAK